MTFHDSIDPGLGTGARLTIDLAALKANYSTLSRRVAPARTAAVVKADAYGLGAIRVAPALAEVGCRDFFVAHLSEAAALKPHLPDEAVLYVLNGLQPGGEPRCAALGIVPVINSLEQAVRWADAASDAGQRLPAVLQVDSGMSRLGLQTAEVEQLGQLPDWFERVSVRLVMSHLACADDPSHPANRDQLQRFLDLARRLPPAPLSIANSGGVFLPEEFHQHLVRPGVALYGVAPHAGRPGAMQPVVRLDACVIQVRSIPAGAGVGYGLSFAAQRATRLATIAVGYADGWPRRLSNRGAAYFDGVRLPIAGRVSMDSLSLDVTALPDGTLGLGDHVELIGAHQSLEDVASDAGTIAYEILTSLGRRYSRVYLDDEAGRDRPIDRG